MAKIQVGCQLSYAGRQVICTSIANETITQVSKWDSATWKSNFHSPGNYKVLAEEWDDFTEGDIIKLDYQRVTLEEPGQTVYYLFPYYKVKKETLSGQ